MTSECWAGFTEEDIKKIKSSNKFALPEDKSLKESLAVNQSVIKIKNFPSATERKDSNQNQNTVQESDERNNYNRLSPDAANCEEFTEECTCECGIIEERIELEKEHYNDESNPKNCNTCDETEQNLSPLEIFDLRQKRIQAENARRRALINKAINDKKKRTQAEAVKLAKISYELNRLDSILSADVSLLRDYIEKASIEFSEAEKRYLKAEKEFVQAKLVLFEKMQRKEMLTEHLCAIIEQNENRKANKLVELMRELEVEAFTDDRVDNMQPILSNLCILNDEAYQSCQTVKPLNLPETKKNNIDLYENSTSSEQSERTSEQCLDIKDESHTSDEIIQENLQMD